MGFGPTLPNAGEVRRSRPHAYLVRSCGTRIDGPLTGGERAFWNDEFVLAQSKIGFLSIMIYEKLTRNYAI